MAENSAIEWCDATFNPWIGCTRVSPGCDNCYAATQDKFRAWTPEGWGGPRKRTAPDTWAKPKKWNDQPFFECPDCGLRGDARAMGDEPKGICRHLNARPARQRVFCASLADVFDNQVPNEWRHDLFDVIRRTRNLDWLLLTKRIGNALTMLPCDFNPERYPHVAIGATIVNQEEADRDIPKLRALNARVRFLSMEPLLGPVDLPRAKAFGLHGFGMHAPGVDWVIAGGESGHGARPMHPDWARSLRDQCAAAGVPFLFKQWGEWLPISDMAEAQTNALYRSNRKARDDEDQGAIDESYGRTCTVPSLAVHPDGTALDVLAPMAWTAGAMQTFRVGKKAAGRVLDGRTHDEFPT